MTGFTLLSMAMACDDELYERVKKAGRSVIDDLPDMTPERKEKLRMTYKQRVTGKKKKKIKKKR